MWGWLLESLQRNFLSGLQPDGGQAGTEPRKRDVDADKPETDHGAGAARRGSPWPGLGWSTVLRLSQLEDTVAAKLQKVHPVQMGTALN